jgi:hypothetical protein
VVSSTRSKCWSVQTIADDALTLEPAEAEAVAAEAARFASLVSGDDARSRYGALASAAAQGSVPSELLPALEALLDLLLQRQPLAQQALLGVFQQTPRGQALATATRDVNAALRSLYGQPLTSFRLNATPGRYSLTIETDRARLTVVLDQAGPHIESLETG